MTSIYDIQQLLKKFGTIIYTGDRVADLELMADELHELHEAKLIEATIYEAASFVLRQEMQKQKDKLH
ncbi:MULTISPECIES: YqgQ family protein [Bacillaceae]|uniref:YqgQ family protein n=1 Tax=Ectobacillus funiculus TaxID=137993 RepID=A0ABV5WME2_9BACI|nr:YqgQ family protein [Ectobacillus funiculus]